MGIKSFFKKVGGWVKDKFHKAKNVVAKFAKPVIKVAKKVVNFVDKTPIGPVLSKVSGGIFDTAKKVINLLPDGEVKKNVQNFAGKAEATKRVEELTFIPRYTDFPDDPAELEVAIAKDSIKSDVG